MLFTIHMHTPYSEESFTVLSSPDFSPTSDHPVAIYFICFSCCYLPNGCIKLCCEFTVYNPIMLCTLKIVLLGLQKLTNIQECLSHEVVNIENSILT